MIENGFLRIYFDGKVILLWNVEFEVAVIFNYKAKWFFYV